MNCAKPFCFSKIRVDLHIIRIAILVHLNPRKWILTNIAEVQDVSLLVPRRLVEAVSDQVVGVFPLDDITPDDDDTWIIKPLPPLLG